MIQPTSSYWFTLSYGHGPSVVIWIRWFESYVVSDPDDWGRDSLQNTDNFYLPEKILLILVTYYTIFSTYLT